MSNEFVIGGGAPLTVFAGPCVLEEADLAVELAARLAGLAQERGLPFVFKASFDKANRTSLSSYRGPGLDAGLEVLARVKREAQVKILTDIHDPVQAQPAAEVVDVLQVPAFLCRQTDLLVAAGQTGKPVNIKKGQFMAPQDMAYAAEKVAASGGRPMLTERGSAFGYRDLVVDMRSLVVMRGLKYPVLFDGTHSVQQPGAAGGRSGGLREMVAPLVRAAVAVGVDGVYLEVHPEPDRSPSDAANSLSPEMFAEVLDQLTSIQDAMSR